MHQSSNFFSLQELGEVAGGVHVKDDDGHAAVQAEGIGRLVHDLEVLGDGLVEGEFIVLNGRWILFRVRGVDAVYAGAFEEGVGPYFQGPEGCAGVRGGCRLSASLFLVYVSAGYPQGNYDR